MSRKSLVPIELPADPTNNLEAATKQYADTKTTAYGHSHLGGAANWDSMPTTGVLLISNTTNPSTNQPEAGWYVGMRIVGQQHEVQLIWSAEDTIPGKIWRRSKTFAGSWGAWNQLAGDGVAAGGDLTGTYPNPEIGSGKVDSTNLTFNAIYRGHITDGEVTLPKLSATGTKDSTTFLRGDDTWAVPAGGGGAGGGSEPIGSIMMWPTATPPTNWLLCDGTAIPAQYTTLIALVGANTPDWRDLFPVGASASKALGVNGGAATHIHPLSDNGHAQIGVYGTIVAARRIAVPNYAETHRGSGLTSATAVNPAGQGAALRGDTDGGSTLPPYKGTHFIIKAAAPNAVVNSYQVGVSNTGTLVVGTDKTTNVTFPVAFASTPSISLTIVAASSQNIRYPATLVSKSTTGFSYSVSRAVGTAAMDVEWQAMLL